MRTKFPEPITIAERKLAGLCPLCGTDTPLIDKIYRIVDGEEGPEDRRYRYCTECAGWEWK